MEVSVLPMTALTEGCTEVQGRAGMGWESQGEEEPTHPKLPKGIGQGKQEEGSCKHQV